MNDRLLYAPPMTALRRLFACALVVALETLGTPAAAQITGASSPDAEVSTEPSTVAGSSSVAGGEAPRSPLDPGAELDPRQPSAPVYGSRAAVQQSEPMGMRRAAQPDAVDPELPVALSYFASLGVAMSGSYDDAIQSHGFGRSSPLIAMDGSVTYGVLRWLHVGARLGARGRGWSRHDGTVGMLSGVDALALAIGRVHVGPVVDLGLTLGAGVGLASLSLRGATVVGPAPRLHGSLQIGFRLGRGMHIFLRVAWDYFPWNDIDRYGSDVDLGGPQLGLGFEVKT